MALDFPTGPTNGQEYTSGGSTFYWDDTAKIWRRQTAVTNLDNLNDVSATNPNDNDILVYDDATDTWVAEAPPEIPPPLASVFLLMGA
jgi:hypothetical protein